jgi:protein-S-isoprenylcysteine O-methyltransferase Ste14
MSLNHSRTLVMMCRAVLLPVLILFLSWIVPSDGLLLQSPYSRWSSVSKPQGRQDRSQNIQDGKEGRRREGITSLSYRMMDGSFGSGGVGLGTGMRYSRSKGGVYSSFIDVGDIDPPPSAFRNNNADSVVTKIGSKLASFYNYIKYHLVQLQIREARQIYFESLLNDVSVLYKSLMRNFNSGDKGKRGEEWLIGEAVFLVAIFSQIHPALSGLIRIIGTLSGWAGLAMLLSGLWALKGNLSIYLAPGPANELVSTSIYDEVRHPIYGSWILLALSHAININCIDTFIIAGAFAYFLVS